MNKREFKIAGKLLESNELTITEINFLRTVLTKHKNSTTKGNTIIYDAEIATMLGKTTKTIYRTRKALESQKFFKVNKVKKGNAYLITYAFNWTKLEKLGYIEIKANEYKPQVISLLSAFAPKAKKTILTNHNVIESVVSSKEYNVIVKKLSNGKVNNTIGEQRIKGALLLNLVRNNIEDFQYTIK